MDKEKDSAPNDRRRYNRPPEHGQIKLGEVRNPYGSRGKPKDATATEIDKLFLQEGRRVVSQDTDGPVEAIRRLVQAEYFDALRKDEPAARVRLLVQLKESAERIEREDRKFIGHILERKLVLTEQFHVARKTRRPAPDIVPHPHHVHVSSGGIWINGPIDAPGREAWELIKAAIRVAACLHDITRREYRRNPSRAVRTDLTAIEKHRRWLMRAVPKGWNWREEIYCLGSMLDLAKEVVGNVERAGYVPLTIED